MSKSRDNKHRRQRANRKLAEWRIKHSTPGHATVVMPVEIVAVEGKLPKIH